MGIYFGKIRHVMPLYENMLCVFCAKKIISATDILSTL